MSGNIKYNFGEPQTVLSFSDLHERVINNDNIEELLEQCCPTCVPRLFLKITRTARCMRVWS